MNYTQEVEINSSAEKTFIAITKQLNDWWGKTDKSVAKIGDEFTTTFGKAYWKFKVVEFIPNKKVTWSCLGGEPEFNAEWIGTTLYWDIDYSGNLTQVRFKHDGLTPELQCYNICAQTWNMFISQSLKEFLEKGKGNPHIF